MLPEKFLERMQQMLGDEYEEFVKALEGERYQALRLNTLKMNDRGQSAAEVFANSDVAENGFAHLEPVDWAENGYYYEKEDQPGKHPYHEAGVYYIQEPSAMAPVELLEVCPGERILDLCAAPGGKSTQIAAKLQGEGILVCNEINPSRAKILSENVERMGIVNACVTNETPANLAVHFPGHFDKILVDAPCSGEGMFRKNEAACFEWSPENVELCAARQDEILDCAAGMLRPGGRLVYSTCTFAPAEDEGSVERFLLRHGEFSLIRDMRLWPHKVKGEGHYAAVLVKAGENPGGFGWNMTSGSGKSVNRRELGEYPDFLKTGIHIDDNSVISQAAKAIRLAESGNGFTYLRYGDNIYITPAGLPSLKGLKVLRPGLHAGSLKKNRFEPSHALALALSPKDVNHVWNLDVNDVTVVSYLKGETFAAEGEKGWYLICANGFSLGWGKLAGGVMKNHYPRGLRKS